MAQTLFLFGWYLSDSPHIIDTTTINRVPISQTKNANCDINNLNMTHLCLKCPTNKDRDYIKQRVVVSMSAPPTNKDRDYIKQRVVVSMSATPNEILSGLNSTINWILSEDQTYKIDAFYIQIPYMQIRNNNKLYPTTSKLQSLFPQQKVIINRLFVDYGPMSRYIGIMNKETDPETIIISFDVDIEHKKRVNNFISKFVKHIKYDPNSWWTIQAESPVFSISKQEVIHLNWTRFPFQYDDENGIAWERRTVFRAVSGVAYKRKFLDNLWYNATEYYTGCFWDDDHWMSFNLERKGIMIKRLVRYTSDRQKRRRLGSLSTINTRLKSKKICTENIMKIHPNIWTEMRVP